ncbi:MAG: hypothetical protein H0V17_19640 [Deltaproteobacteria bacterium]|nr:hypothetical protein [Deltaproteobacteria bacterium]
MAPPNDDDRKAKDVLESELDPAARADLERWFGLPSFDELAARGISQTVENEDPQYAEVRERQARALAAVDPVLLAELARRSEPRDDLIIFQPNLEVTIDPSIARIDLAMIESSIADPREVEISEALRDDLRDCTPQAILRDLHRPEIDFEKTFEIIDMAAAQTLDIVAEVRSAMRTSWALPPLDGTPLVEARAVMAQLIRDRRRPWGPLLAEQPLPNRTWKPEEDR